MSVRGKLARVEKAAGVGEMCLRCRHHLVLYSEVIDRTPADDLLTLPCGHCGFPVSEVLAGHTERERELLREYSTTPRTPLRSLKERQRRYALSFYILFIPAQRRLRDGGEEVEKRLRAVQRPGADVRRMLRVLDEWNAGQLEAKGVDLNLLWQRHSRRASTRPVHEALEVVKAGGIQDEELYNLSLLMALEPFVFGHVLPETVRRIEERKSQLQAEAERRERAARELDERLARERAEREERYRREREQRERERLARLEAQSRPPEGPRPAPADDGYWFEQPPGPVMVPGEEPSTIEEIIAANTPSTPNPSRRVAPWKPRRYKPGGEAGPGRPRIIVPEIPPPPEVDDPTAGLTLVPATEAASLTGQRRWKRPGG